MKLIYNYPHKFALLAWGRGGVVVVKTAKNILYGSWTK